MVKYLVVWGAALGVIAYLVKGVKIGPVIFVVSERHGLGVHSGDFLALIPLALALAATVYFMKRNRAA